MLRRKESFHQVHSDTSSLVPKSHFEWMQNNVLTVNDYENLRMT